MAAQRLPSAVGWTTDICYQSCLEKEGLTTVIEVYLSCAGKSRWSGVMWDRIAGTKLQKADAQNIGMSFRYVPTADSQRMKAGGNLRPIAVVYNYQIMEHTLFLICKS